MVDKIDILNYTTKGLLREDDSTKRVPYSAKMFYPSERLMDFQGVQLLGYDKIDDNLFYYYRGNKLLQVEDPSTVTLAYKPSDYLTNSGGKNFPANSSPIGKILRFKDYLYYISQDTSDGNKIKVWRTLPQAGDTDFSWTLVHAMGTGVTAIPKCGFDSDDDYIYIGEYGDASYGAKIWRSSDGTNWIQSWINANSRHVHDIKVDPFTGFIWATIGDDLANGKQNDVWVIKSQNQGESWTNIITDVNYQGVQISFDKDYVFISADSSKSRGTVFIINKNNNSVCHASTNNHYSIPFPAAQPYSYGTLTSGATPATSLPSYWYKLNISVDYSAFNIVTLDYTQCTTGATTAAEMQTKIRALGGVFSNITVTYTNSVYVITSGTKGNASQVRMINAGSNDATVTLKLNAENGATVTDGTSETFDIWAYYGIVDPITGVYYCVTSQPANARARYGLFYLPEVGGKLQLLDYFPNDPLAFYATEMVIAGGYLYWGGYRRPLLTMVDV